nr:PQQ-dependent sugar dehydrogenase [Deltaproteobacteria bacterium]
METMTWMRWAACGLGAALLTQVGCAAREKGSADAGDASDVSDVMDVRDARDVTDVVDVTDARDVTDVVDVTDARDVTDVTDVTDAPPVADVPWGLDRRPVNRTCVAFPAPEAGAVRAVMAFPGVGVPLATTMLQRPGDNGRWYLTQSTGIVYRIQTAPALGPALLVADLRDRITTGGESGLLGMAFHPRFATNGMVYLSYTRPLRAGETGAFVSRITRMRSRDGGDTLDRATEEVLLEIPQPFNNHNGGNIVFGPDGFLYAGFGDGGSGGDPYRYGQNTNTLLGKFLRIDVDRADGARLYSIPADNPYARGGGRPEIYAIGLRNPWRWSFDRATGELWAGDVGQATLEEVDVIHRGGDYGWSTLEGSRCFREETCSSAGTVLPVLEYPRTDGISIIGGFVYRGRAMPWLTGRFVFGDYGSGRVWAIAYDSAGRATKETLVETGQNLYTFGQDQDGELYVVPTGGAILRLVPGATAPVDPVPRTLRATGCVDPANVLLPASGLIPYAPSAPFWSDGADKERFMALPEGGRITIGADGDWQLPSGTVLVKHFAVGGRRVETRLFVRHLDGAWRGYTYRWNDAQTDATLLDGSEARDLPGGLRWYYPSRSQCMQCHSEAAGRSLGLETAQLDTPLRYAATGRMANQLVTLDHLGLFDRPLAAMRPPAYPDPYAPGPDEGRARSWLHTNCSACHRPGGIGRGSIDLRFSTPLAMTGTCNVAPSVGDLGIRDARIIVPGDPARSILHARIAATNLHRMPPISSGVVDAAGVALIDRWVRSLTRCP